ncbi:MAG: dUTP diphosphatase [Coriobacteriia bacterium]|nr:dUTP diphosphatase [Coriobacteriia bacterium]
MMDVELPIKLLSEDIRVPSYAHSGDAGMDLRSAVDVTLQPFERKLIPTGISLAIPPGFAGFVQPRSGMAIKYGLSLVNTPGLIDSAYRGEIKIPAINLDSTTEINIHAGDRIAQLVILPFASATPVIVEDLDETVRADGGFGSTGEQ